MGRPSKMGGGFRQLAQGGFCGVIEGMHKSADIAMIWGKCYTVIGFLFPP